MSMRGKMKLGGVPLDNLRNWQGPGGSVELRISDWQYYCTFRFLCDAFRLQGFTWHENACTKTYTSSIDVDNISE